MATIDDYMDAARARAGLTSDRELAAVLRVSAPIPSYWRTRRTWPGDDVMVRLAELAGLPVEAALLDLNTWRAKSPSTRALYQRMAATALRAAAGSLVTVFLFGALLTPLPAEAATDGNEPGTDRPFRVSDLYIMRMIVTLWRRVRTRLLRGATAS